MTFLSLAFISAILTAIPVTRLWGLLGWAFLGWMYPSYSLIAASSVVAVALSYYLYRRHKHHEL